MYQTEMRNIANTATMMRTTYATPKEDAAMLLPLGMESTFVVRTNLRNLIDMSHQRLCTRAFWEFRKLMKEIIEALAFYSDEWKQLVEELKVFVPKCKVLGYCSETRTCNQNIPHSREERDELIKFGKQFLQER